MKIPVVVCGAFVLTLFLGTNLAAQMKSLPAVEIRSVRVSTEGTTAVLTISASGPLPAPTVGEVANPNRIFFDFANVSPTTRGIPATGDPLVRRVRIAVNTASPLVTRVVFDLVRHEPFRMDLDDLASGQFRVIVGGASDAPGPEPAAEPPPIPLAGPPVPSPPTAATSGPPPASPSSEPLPSPAPAAVPAPPPKPSTPPPASLAPANAADTIANYKQLIGDALTQVLAMRPMLATIDRFISPTADELQTAGEELDRIRRVLSSIQPPENLRPTHEFLVRACTLGGMAARLRAEANRTNDITQVRNAGSAAAGARLLLDRVCLSLGC